MEKLKLNETPVRTSRNFNINNIKLENVDIPEDIENFDNVVVSNETSKIYVSNEKTNCELTYGLNETLRNQVSESPNQNLKIVIDSKVNKTIEIDFKLDENNSSLVEKIDIIANEDSIGTVIIKYNTVGDNKYFHNGIIKVLTKNNSNINIIIANLVNNNSDNFLCIENTCEENSKLNYHVVDFGGKNSITNYYTNLLGDNSDNKINTIYLGKENQVFDLNYIAELRGKKSNIDIEVQGALKDTSKKHFKGTIDFKKGCKKATGNENEACMLMSNTAKSLALPMLLCSEEEVEGNHSSSSGKVGEKELFYIMSRGFDYKSAMKLLVRAKFNKILENISSERLRNEVLHEINTRLD